MKQISRVLIVTVLAAFAFSSLGFAANKKIVFLADRGKNAKTHAHESGNELLAKALEDKWEAWATRAKVKPWPWKFENP